MGSYLKFKAGKSIISMIRDEGVRAGRVRVLAGPAGGPKWFVSVGFDRCLMKSGFLCQTGDRVMLAGASAGAWRCLAMACRDPLAAYEKLRTAYSRNVFTAEDTPITLSAALRANVESFLSAEDIPFILDHPVFDLAVHCVRGRSLSASERKGVQGVGLVVGALLNLFSGNGMRVFFERVVFFSGRQVPGFLGSSFRGSSVRLTPENMRQAALATGSLPYIIAGVNDIPGAAPGVYRDGGILDYQLNQDYVPGEGHMTLFFHYQERIVPGWFDKRLTWRKAPAEALDRVLQVYPGEDFIRLLPDGRLPDRTDFKVFVHDPVARIRRWDEVARVSEILGEEFFEAVQSGRIRRLVQPL